MLRLAPVSGSDPIAVRLGRSLFPLREREAAAIMVTRAKDPQA